jgi:hypothetical protein
MPKAQQRKHNQVHSVERKLRKKENALVRNYLTEAKRPGLPWRCKAAIYKKLFTLLERRVKEEAEHKQKLEARPATGSQ